MTNRDFSPSGFVDNERRIKESKKGRSMQKVMEKLVNMLCIVNM